MRNWVLSFWQKRNLLTFLLLPFSWLFILITSLRYHFYKLIGQTDLKVPVIVVGNISLGGTGKTPLVIHLANYLRSQGYRPGIVLRGYGSSLSTSQFMRVYACTDSSIAGDESVLLAQSTSAPVVIGARRQSAIQYLLEICPDVNIVLSDDGLQHYAMKRSVEIAVIDGQQRLGNGYCLPAGPLREPQSRLKRVDFVVCNGIAQNNEWSMQCGISHAVNLQSKETKQLSEFKNKNIHVFAAIGNPARFLHMLKDCGLSFTPHIFPDHYSFLEKDFEKYKNDIILMTEKDAVKCKRFKHENLWYVPLSVTLEQGFHLALIRSVQNGQEIARDLSVPNL